jgi:hypothetical protein
VELANGFRRALSQASSIARGGHGKRTQSRRPWNQWGQLTSVRLAQLSRQWRTLHQTRVVQRTLVHDAFMRSDPVQRVKLRSRGSNAAVWRRHIMGVPYMRLTLPRELHQTTASITPQSRQLGNLGRHASRSLPSASAGAHAAPLVGLLGVS